MTGIGLLLIIDAIMRQMLRNPLTSRTSAVLVLRLFNGNKKNKNNNTKNSFTECQKNMKTFFLVIYVITNWPKHMWLTLRNWSVKTKTKTKFIKQITYMQLFGFRKALQPFRKDFSYKNLKCNLTFKKYILTQYSTGSNPFKDSSWF